ncbi:Short C-terminal domain-containing protein [Evansella caseinilytica]|uniref:Short C-terminal domain-containing protein n=1 Tax=Evansella caseinilytica TaxID=1503961 RepID=A0A1H3NVN1_9BACI|nr:SHOCT domain-containing protein [Evansella caseinilytica]SDY92951.1 Short C-terminal domain-containing protein [Evansella caseinilytica]
METYEFKGFTGTVIVTPKKVILKYKRFLGPGKGEKEIRIKSITGIQLKKPGFTNGYIQFVYSGSSEVKGKSAFDAANDENTIMINSKKQYNKFLKCKELIEQYQDQIEDSGGINPISAADELKKLAELKDAGILTEEEFNAKKKQLLCI